MSHLAPRTCTELVEASPASYRGASRPITEFRKSAAYVLLGDPGMGKTEAFRREAADSGGYYVTARDFVTLGTLPGEVRPESVFIDELDELRVASSDRRKALDDIRRKLDQLGISKFRIACRAAHWYGRLDRESLKAISADRNVKVLLLDPLSDGNIRDFLHLNSNMADPDTLIPAAHKAGVVDLVRNPLHLKAIAGSFPDGEPPKSRKQLWDRQCARLLAESNDAMQLARRDEPGAAYLMESAEYLCALLLLSSRQGYTGDGTGTDDFPRIQDLPHDDIPQLRRILDSGLFSATAERRFVPVLRQVCEFLAARYTTRLVQEKGLPLDRVWNLATDDGGRIEPGFGSFAAWLSEFATTEHRRRLIRQAPAEILTHAEIKGFAPNEKRLLLHHSVKAIVEGQATLMQVLASPYLGGFATSDMRDWLVGHLNPAHRDDEQTTKVLILMEVLSRADSDVYPSGELMRIARDAAWELPIRLRALQTVLYRYDVSQVPVESDLKSLAEDINERPHSEENDAILGRLLPKLYPSVLTPNELVRYLHTPVVFPDMSYILFWTTNVRTGTVDEQLPELLDALAARLAEVKRYDQQLAKTIRELLLITTAHNIQTLAQLVDEQRLVELLQLTSCALSARTFEFGTYHSETNLRYFLETRLNIQGKLLQQADGRAMLEELFAPPFPEREPEREKREIEKLRRKLEYFFSDLEKIPVFHTIPGQPPNRAAHTLRETA